MVWIYDIESLANFFSYYAVERDTGEERWFYIHEDHNDLDALRKHLNDEVKGHIGYNCVAYDYPVLHKMMLRKTVTAEQVYKISQGVIEAEFSGIRANKVKIPQLDLFLIKHYNNVARSTSLKWLEFTLRWKKLQDMPIHHTDFITKDQVNDIKEYNINDVEATQMFYKEHCLKDINFRKNMSKKLGKNVLNFSDVKIGEYLNQITYEKLSGRDYREFKEKRTYHARYHLNDIIEDNIEFQTPYLQKFFKELKLKDFKAEDDKNIDIILKFANHSFKFAKGGLHSEDGPRIESKKDNEILVEKDVASFYPKSIVNGKLYPRHLGIEWSNGVTSMYNRRTDEIKPLLKTLDKHSIEYEDLNTEGASIKLSLNGGIFGKLGSQYSWQYDPIEKYKITINCELKLLILIEAFDLKNIKIISANTDGVVIKYDKSQQKDVDDIHKWWEKKFDYILEDTYYNQIIFMSVNDYIAEIVDKDTDKVLYSKLKGDFEIDKEPHKNNSQRIIPIALKEYFLNNVKLSDIIGNFDYKFINSNDEQEQVTIYDYCIGKKKAKDQLYHYVEKGKTTKIVDKVIRYYIIDSYHSQNKIFKEYKGGKKGEKAKQNNTRALEAISKGFNHKLFMDFEESEDYHINKLYYNQECMKIIEVIERNTRLASGPKVEQLNLF